MSRVLQAANSEPLDVLMFETWPLHNALEKRLGIPDSFVSKTVYSKALMLFYVFQRQVSLSIPIFRSQVRNQLSLPLRDRLPLVSQDMHRLEIPSPANLGNYPTLHVHSLDEFYGCIYVSEISTLFGNSIQSLMLKTYGKASLDWTRSLNPYGEQTQPMWQSFCAALLEELARGSVTLSGVIKGAEKSFQYKLDIAYDLGFTDK